MHGFQVYIGCVHELNGLIEYVHDVCMDVCFFMDFRTYWMFVSLWISGLIGCLFLYGFQGLFEVCMNFRAMHSIIFCYMASDIW